MNFIDSALNEYGIKHIFLEDDELENLRIDLFNKIDVTIIKYSGSSLDSCVSKILKANDLYQYKPGNSYLEQVYIHGNERGGYVVFEKNNNIKKNAVYRESNYDQASFLPRDILMKISKIEEFNFKNLGFDEFKEIQSIIKNNANNDSKDAYNIYGDILSSIVDCIQSNWGNLSEYYNKEILLECPAYECQKNYVLDENKERIYCDRHTVLIKSMNNENEVVNLRDFIYSKVDFIFRKFFHQTGRNQEFWEVKYENLPKDSRINALYNTIEILSVWSVDMDLNENEKNIMINLLDNIRKSANEIFLQLKKIDTELHFHPKSGDFFYTFIFQLIIFYIKYIQLLNIYDVKLLDKFKAFYVAINNNNNKFVAKTPISEQGKNIIDFFEVVDRNHLEIYCLMYFHEKILKKYPKKNKKLLDESLLEIWKLLSGKENKLRQHKKHIKMPEKQAISTSFFEYGTKSLSFDQYFYASFLIDEQNLKSENSLNT
jgi:hypothetical protein